MSRIDEIQARLDEALKVRPYEEQDRDEHKSKAWSDFYQHAPNDIAWLLDALARRDQRCEDLAVSLDETRRDLLHAERWEQEVTDVLHTVHAMCLHGDPQHQIAEYIEQHDHRYQATKKEN